jgi:DNA-binding MarR family transcriptional regulator
MPPKAPRGKTTPKTAALASAAPDLSFAASTLDKHVGFMLRLAMAAVLGDFASALKKFGLRPAQYACLLVVQSQPGLKQQRIGEILTVKHSNLVAIINFLESRGYVDRARPNSDRRANIIYLTKVGTELLTRAAPVVNAHNARLIEALGDHDVENVLDSLQRLANLEWDSAGLDRHRRGRSAKLQRDLSQE